MGSDRQRQVHTQHQKSEKQRKLVEKMAQKRKALTLDLNAAAGVGPSGLGNFSKKSKLAASHILTSPDVQKLKLSSPELAEFLTRNPTLAKHEPAHTRTTSIETIGKAAAAHRASKLAPAALEVSPRPESSASGSMDSAELRIKEEIEDED